MTYTRRSLIAGSVSSHVLLSDVTVPGQTEGVLPPQFLLSFIENQNINLYNQMVSNRATDDDFIHAVDAWLTMAGWMEEAGVESMLNAWLNKDHSTFPAGDYYFSPASMDTMSWLRTKPQEAFAKTNVSLNCTMTDTQATAYVLSCSQHYAAYNNLFVRSGIPGFNTAVIAVLTEAAAAVGASHYRLSSSFAQNLGIAQQWVATFGKMNLYAYWGFYVNGTWSHWPGAPPIPGMHGGGIDFPVAIYPLPFIFARLKNLVS